MWGLSQKEKDEELKQALSRENWKEVKKCLDRGANPDGTPSSHRTPLFTALYNYDQKVSLDTVSALLSHKADVNKKDEQGCTAIHYLLLTRARHTSVLKKLLDAGADLDAVYNGGTPLGRALDSQAWEAAGLILDRKPDQDRGPAGGATLLMTAVSRGAPLDLIKKIMAKPLDVNAMSGGMAPALYLAAQAGRQDVVELLLACPGVDVNAADGRGNTALLAAVGQGNIEISAALLKAGADANRANRDGNTPLVTAQGAELVRMLLARRAAPDTADKAGITPLLAAARRKDAGAARVLLKGGAAPDLADNDGKTPLLTAALAKDSNTVRALLAGGATPDLADKAGNTPLMAAVLQGDKETTEALLKAGATPGLAAPGGKTLLLSAVTQNNAALVAVLLAAGARPEVAGPDGLLPLDAAVQQGSAPIVTALLASAKAAGVTLVLEPALLAAAEKGICEILEPLIAAGADVNTVDVEGRTPLIKAALTDKIEPMSILIKAGAKTDAGDARGMQAYDHAVAAKKNQSKDYLARFRSGGAPGLAIGAAGEEGRYTMVNGHSLEVRESENLSVIFNFWMQQVIFRDVSGQAPVVLQSFADVPRQEAVEEAYRKLKSLGGDPPEPPGLRKKAPILTSPGP